MNIEPEPVGGPAASELHALVYDELHAVASALMQGERPGHTLQPTAIVHEVYLRLVDQARLADENPARFRALAAVAIRHFLVDYARRSLAEKRGGGWSRVTLNPELSGPNMAPESLLAVDEALERLRRLDERQARVVELRFYGGLSVEETASELEVSPRTVAGDWSLARAWLGRELNGGAQ